MNRVFYIFLFFLVSLCCETKGQTNLIYNGDFEIYNKCPQNASGPFSLPYEIENCNGWTAPTYGTSDYFNVCNNSINGIVGVPNNTVGSQKPFSGNSYCGFLAYSLSNGGCYGGSYWWEYIQGRFIQPLVSGHIYTVCFRFSLAESSDIAVKQLGFYISNSIVSNSCSPAPLSYTPQIISTGNAFLSDTANWISISGQYTASGGERYITIGNFKDSLTTDTVCFYSANIVTQAYYYIDAGSVYDVTDENICNHEEVTLPNIFTPNEDGVNDVFKISDTCFTVLGLSVYNRWGNLIMDSKTNSFWDGRTTSGEACSDGIYYYIIGIENTKGNTETKKGFIQLIR